MPDLKAWFDTSNYVLDNLQGFPHRNKGRIRVMKDECAGRIITHFVGLCPKLYAYVVANEQCIHKAKGVKPNMLQSLRYEDYLDCLENCTRVMGTQFLFHSHAYQVYTKYVTKVVLSVGTGHDGLLANFCDIPGDILKANPAYLQRGSAGIAVHSVYLAGGRRTWFARCRGASRPGGSCYARLHCSPSGADTMGGSTVTGTLRSYDIAHLARHDDLKSFSDTAVMIQQAFTGIITSDIRRFRAIALPAIMDKGTELQKEMVTDFRDKGSSISETGTFVLEWHHWCCGICGSPRAIDARGERRPRRYVKANRQATEEQLAVQMNQGGVQTHVYRSSSANPSANGLRIRRRVTAPVLNTDASTKTTGIFSTCVRRDTSGNRHPASIAGRTQGVGGSVMVCWGMLSWHSLGPIIRVVGTPGQFGYESILGDHVHPYMTIVFPREDGIFQYDNSPCHTARIVVHFSSWFHNISRHVFTTHAPGNVAPRMAQILGRAGVAIGLIASTKANRVRFQITQMEIVPDDAAAWRVFTGISRSPRPCIPALLLTHSTSPSSALKTPDIKSRPNLSTQLNLVFHLCKGAIERYTSAFHASCISSYTYTHSIKNLLRPERGIEMERDLEQAIVLKPRLRHQRSLPDDVRNKMAITIALQQTAPEV
ncbi:hypothetical protein PR048_003394 [Dryococelus australis]|uniref:Uncharacterized protein n=1 Tax=Dryococelus australis TaxID=614101 RepID=A0ABQ9IMY5_9NEOP|nr:hypothetical protein PR048_003394 [Dryococelus australis]